METQKIEISVSSGKEKREVDAYMVGGLAVHKYHHPHYEIDDWVITSPEHGLKFPGQTSGFKAAMACAEELDKLFSWPEYDPLTHKDEAAKAKKILAQWGLYDVDRLD